MACHEMKRCPKCNKAFECKPGNITQCQCFGLKLTEPENDYMRDTYNDCLCGDCLGTIKYEMRYNKIKNKMLTILSIFK